MSGLNIKPPTPPIPHPAAVSHQTVASGYMASGSEPANSTQASHQNSRDASMKDASKEASAASSLESLPANIRRAGEGAVQRQMLMAAVQQGTGSSTTNDPTTTSKGTGRKRTFSEGSRKSGRLLEAKQALLDAINAKLKDIPTIEIDGQPMPEVYNRNNLTRLMHLPLKPGSDQRGYLTSEARAEMSKAIESSCKTGKLTDILSEAETEFYREAKIQTEKQKPNGSKDNTYELVGRTDGGKKGEDWALTINDGIDRSGERGHQDTPNPLSSYPVTEESGAEKKAVKAVGGQRLERAHTMAHSLTGKPGKTVWAPTTANQGIDTVHEQRVAENKDAFMVVRTNYWANATLSAVPVVPGKTGMDDEWKVMVSSYSRRTPVKADPAASTPASPTSPTTPFDLTFPRHSRRMSTLSNTFSLNSNTSEKSENSTTSLSRRMKNALHLGKEKEAPGSAESSQPPTPGSSSKMSSLLGKFKKSKEPT